PVSDRRAAPPQTRSHARHVPPPCHPGRKELIAMLTPALVLAARLAVRMTSEPSRPRCSAVPAELSRKKEPSKADLQAAAKIDETAARRTALESTKDATAEVVESELELEHGCLVWSFDIRLKEKPGVDEVQVDAGDGKVLSQHHETARAEADEKAKEKPKQ